MVASEAKRPSDTAGTNIAASSDGTITISSTATMTGIVTIVVEGGGSAMPYTSNDRKPLKPQRSFIPAHVKRPRTF